MDTYGDDIEEIAKQKRFVPDKGFEGADVSAPRGSGPVQFEQDIFGVDELLADVKRVSKMTVTLDNRYNLSLKINNSIIIQ